MLAETGMSMVEKSGVSKRAAAAVRGDVASLGLSLTKAKKVADVARESKNKAMAAKRSAEKAAREAKKDAEEKQRLIDLAKDAADAEHASRVKAEEANRVAKKQLELRQRRVDLLEQKMARLTSEKREQDKKYRELAAELGLKRRERAPPPAPAAAAPAVGSSLVLRHQVINEARRAAQRERDLQTMRKLVTANANLRRQGSRQRETIVKQASALKEHVAALKAAREPSPAPKGIFEVVQGRLRPIDAASGSIEEGGEEKDASRAKQSKRRSYGLHAARLAKEYLESGVPLSRVGRLIMCTLRLATDMELDVEGGKMKFHGTTVKRLALGIAHLDMAELIAMILKAPSSRATSRCGKGTRSFPSLWRVGMSLPASLGGDYSGCAA
ncbi:unnamed protein product [Ectocarpus sp. CCAP 1310/34]|nr:unnamed protein product [Ectocarpus sp. CCAP 1310/34]